MELIIHAELTAELLTREIEFLELEIENVDWLPGRLIGGVMQLHHKWVRQSIFHRDSFIRIKFKHFHHQIHGVRINVF